MRVARDDVRRDVVILVEEVLVNGRWPLLLPRHRAARREWPWWEATRLAAMHTVIGTGSVVWDVGAEEGDFPALWSSWGADVALAEPNPRVWPNIKAVFDANDLADPMLCWPGFLADRFDDQPREYLDTGPWPASASGEVIGDHGFCQLGERPDIPTSTIDLLVDDGVPAPTVITMDVEGSELFVLRGAEHTLSDHRPHVFVSVHQEFARHHYAIEDVTAEIDAFMRRLDYDDTYLCTDHEAHWWWQPR